MVADVPDTELDTASINAARQPRLVGSLYDLIVNLTEEPYEVNTHVRICAGGGQQWPFLPRYHNPLGFTIWMAGGGVQGGYAHGETDDYGYRAIKDKVDIHDLHATILHLLGMDHKQLTFRHAGRDFRLTDVHGNVVQEVLV